LLNSICKQLVFYRNCTGSYQGKKTSKNNKPPENPTDFQALGSSYFQFQEQGTLALFFHSAYTRNVTESVLAEVSCGRRGAGHGHMLYHRQM